MMMMIKKAQLTDFPKHFRTLVKDFPSKCNLLICSPPGSGKTHFARAIQQKFGGNYKLQSQFFREIRMADSQNQHNFIEKLVDEPILIIDEFGSSKGSPFELNVLHEVIERRSWENPTGFLLLTNVMPNDLLNTVGERIWERIYANFKILIFKGKSARLFSKDEREMNAFVFKENQNIPKPESEEDKKAKEEFKNIMKVYEKHFKEASNG